MKIQVNDGEHKISILLPTNLIFSGGTAWLADHVGRKYAPEALENIPPEALNALFAEFRRIKHQYGRWTLVEVESAAGQTVKITL